MQTKEQFPKGLSNAYWFALFNAFSFQIVLSSPMVLYAKSLGASATTLGLIYGMMPMLVILQIPAAAYLPRVGYKRFVLGGWGIRVFFIAGMATVPWLGSFLNQATQLTLILALLFGFNLFRGISSCAWLPWITSIVPGTLRGRYLLTDAASANSSSFLTFIMAAWVLGTDPAGWQFSALFAFSACAGGISLLFLRRIPETSSAAEASTSNTPVPWREIANYPPFRKLLRMNLAWALGYGGIIAFTTAYMRGPGGMTEGYILWVSSFFFLGGLSSLAFGRLLDQFGSKPLLTFAAWFWVGIVLRWALTAGGAMTVSSVELLVLEYLMGLGYSLVNTANLRLGMAISPEMGRSHFLAIFQVVSNLTLGLAPVLWGLLIDACAQVHGHAWVLELNRYSLFFIGAGVCFAVMIGLTRKLEEPSASKVQHLLREILIHAPQRVWSSITAK